MTLVRPGGELLGDLRHSPENTWSPYLFRWEFALDTGGGTIQILSVSTRCNYTGKVEAEKLQLSNVKLSTRAGGQGTRSRYLGCAAPSTCTTARSPMH